MANCACNVCESAVAADGTMCPFCTENCYPTVTVPDGRRARLAFTDKSRKIIHEAFYGQQASRNSVADAVGEVAKPFVDAVKPAIKAAAKQAASTIEAGMQEGISSAIKSVFDKLKPK